MILLLDNYDSFTYNLVHYVEQLTDEAVMVRRNDATGVEEAAKCSGIILSPGPGLPQDAGVQNEIIRKLGSTVPILGVCLGHQAIAEVYGGKLQNLKNVLHGVSREVVVKKDNDRILKGLPGTFQTGHYHSWIVSGEGFPAELQITCTDREGNIMALSHRSHPVSGIQFHPESIMTDFGLQIIRNWLEFCDGWHRKND